MELTPLLDKFNNFFGSYGVCARKNLFVILGAILKTKTVNLYLLRNHVGLLLGHKCSSEQSHYRRLTRFFCQYKCCKLWYLILQFGYELLGGDFKYLYVDGTEWSIGSFKLHILVLAADIAGVAVPLYFKVYEHKGVLSEAERMAFIKDCSQSYPLQGSVLMADREFIGQDWFAALSDSGIDFVIRVRKNQYQHSGQHQHSYEKTRQRALRKGKASMLVQTPKGVYRLWMVKNEQPNQKEPLVYLLTSLLCAQNGAELYKFRWKIEYCFKHLKSNGFNLEDLALKDTDKIRLLVAIVILAYVICIYEAFKSRKEKPVKKKKYKNGTCYDEISLFKQGEAIMQQAFVDLAHLLVWILNILKNNNLMKIVQ